MTIKNELNATTSLTVSGATVLRVDQALSEIKTAVIMADEMETKAKGIVNNALEVWGDAVAAIAPSMYWMNDKLPGFDAKFYQHHRERLKTALLDTKRYNDKPATIDTMINRACGMAAQKLVDLVEKDKLKVDRDTLYPKLVHAAKNAPVNVVKATAARRANAKASKAKEKAKPAKKLTPKAELKAKLKDVMDFAAKHKFASVAAAIKAIKV